MTLRPPDFAAAPTAAHAAPSRGRRAWLGLGVATAVLASGCANWLAPRSIEMSREDIQLKLAQKFPIRKQVLGYIDITASRPQLAMLPDTQRLSTRIDLALDDTMFKKLHQGYVQASFGLRYEPADQTIRLDQVKLDELSMPTLSPVFMDALQRLGQQAARDVLQGYVVKQLKPEELARVDRLGLEVQGLRVTANGLAVDLAPKGQMTAGR